MPTCLVTNSTYWLPYPGRSCISFLPVYMGILSGCMGIISSTPQSTQSPLCCASQSSLSWFISAWDKGLNGYLVTEFNAEGCLCYSLSSLDPSTSLLEVTTEYAAHFYDMYAKGHNGKHLTGDKILILLLNLPFLFHNLIACEVRICSAILDLMSIFIMTSCLESWRRTNSIYDNMCDKMYHLHNEVVAQCCKNTHKLALLKSQ